MNRAIFLIFLLITCGSHVSAQENIPGCDTARAWYYSVDGKYPVSSPVLVTMVQSYVAPVKNMTGSGYITLRFTINCRGLMGKDIEVLQTDAAYKPSKFQQALIDRLIAFVRTLDKWSIASYENGKPLAYRAFMTFKIQDGKIINVIP